MPKTMAGIRAPQSRAQPNKDLIHGPAEIGVAASLSRFEQVFRQVKPRYITGLTDTPKQDCSTSFLREQDPGVCSFDKSTIEMINAAISLALIGDDHGDAARMMENT